MSAMGTFDRFHTLLGVTTLGEIEVQNSVP